MIPSQHQLPKELMNTFISIYRTVNGDKFQFVRKLSLEEDTRFSKMESFEIELMYECVHAIESK